MDIICDYGCNQPAVHIFKSGKACCSKSTSKCHGMKYVNSNKIKTLREGKGNTYWKNGHPKGSINGTSLKGKTYEEIFGLEQSSIQRQKISQANKGHNRWHTLSDETRNRLAEEQSARIILRYEQGWMPKAGRCKKIKYISPIAGEVLLDGTWELAAAQYMDHMQWNWKRNTIRFPYINLKGKLSHYTPDFWVEELNGYLEVKGYETDLDRCKWLQFKNQLTVWKKDVILDIMERGQAGNAADC